mmetsp:Transcript_14180/g.28601  ORF Transcript_14180/g.28601 Transcript_14180/m.28601 type:complete len:104 (+) Transcript_14180:100-411(+)
MDLTDVIFAFAGHQSTPLPHRYTAGVLGWCGMAKYRRTTTLHHPPGRDFVLSPPVSVSSTETSTRLQFRHPSRKPFANRSSINAKVVGCCVLLLKEHRFDDMM